MANFVGRFSGIVSYSDDTHEQFAAHRDERGNISVNGGISDTPNSSNQAVLEVQTDNNWLEDMIDLLSATLAFAPLGTAAKTVNGAVMHFSGRIARDDNTWEDFAVQYDIKADGSFILNSSGAGGGADISAYTEFLDETLTPWFAELFGTAQVTAP